MKRYIIDTNNTSHSRYHLYLFALMLVIYEFTTYAANDMIMPALPEIMRQFHASIVYAVASFSVYMLGSCSLQLILGPLAEIYGRRQIILTGNFLFLLFTTGLALSRDVHIFMLWRFLQGSCMAFTPLGYALIHSNFNDKQALRLTALMGNIIILAPLIGPAIGATIISHVSWRYVFGFSLLSGGVSLYGLYRYTPTSLPHQLSTSLPVKQIFISYCHILNLRNFLVGMLALVTIVLPALVWMATAPTFILLKLHLSMHTYILYQLLSQSGLMLGCILIQFIAGRLSLIQIILIGLIIAVTGILLGMIFPQITVVVIGLSIYTFGLGWVVGVIMRIVGTLPTETPSMLFSLLAFLQTLLMAIGLEIINHILKFYSYGLIPFTMVNFCVVIIASVLVLSFACLNRKRRG